MNEIDTIRYLNYHGQIWMKIITMDGSNWWWTDRENYLMMVSKNEKKKIS